MKELALNIWKVGLLQNLIVHPMKVGARRAQTFGAAAGERRRLALIYLFEHDYIPADHPVRCRVVPVEDAVLLSATENEMREPMHPADACDAYRILVESGRSIEEIADLYGV
ncbi:ParB/Srx family N-terminal domain-containing protein, partial [Burkholderia cenocepacia]|uniref:ParB/Srx family N-terminal domain-containing protein n=1 Tax=Burkholderia cenocepacia TaxID=95486 RepID=UPI002231595B|nr:ParB/Srx family N-terminal domain-containing protein [Burkholderia cenocepacia]